MPHRFANYQIRHTESGMASHFNERHGLVTSYDPKTHLAKVAYQPEGEESSWLPIETGHSGNGWGILVGLTPGSGKGDNKGGAGSGGGSGSSGSGAGDGGAGGAGDKQYQGDMVSVRFQEGDLESGMIVRRIHNDTDKPPKVEAGEMLMMHSLGHRMFFKKDGSLHIYGKTSKQDDQGSSGGGSGVNSTSSSSLGSSGDSGQGTPLKNAPPLQPQTYKVKVDPRGITTISHYQQKQSGNSSGSGDPPDPNTKKSPAYYSTMVTDPSGLNHTHTTYHEDQNSQSDEGGGGKPQPATSQGDPGMDSKNENQAKMFSQTVHNSKKKQLHHTTYDEQGKKKHQVIMDNHANKLTVQTFEQDGEHPQHQMIMDQSSGRFTCQTCAGGQQMAQITLDKQGNINKQAKGKLTIHAQGGIESQGAWKHSGGYTGDVVNASMSMSAPAGSVPGPTPGTGGGQAGVVGAPIFQSGGSASNTSSTGSGSSPQQG